MKCCFLTNTRVSIVDVDSTSSTTFFSATSIELLAIDFAGFIFCLGRDLVSEHSSVNNKKNKCEKCFKSFWIDKQQINAWKSKKKDQPFFIIAFNNQGSQDRRAHKLYFTNRN